VVESLIDGFVGDYKGFQARMEGVEVSAGLSSTKRGFREIF
jgi:hypothetical protein